MRFELTRAEPIGLAVQRLNYSATQSLKSNFQLLSTNNLHFRGFVSKLAFFAGFSHFILISPEESADL
jgi:hypothetical protein